MKDRPLSLKRYPNGIQQQFFFQKDAPLTFAPWLRTEEIYSDHNEAPIRYVFAEDRASLLYLVNLGCIDHNPWMSRSPSLDNPDFVLIDLDPQDCPYDMIVEAALLVREKLDAIGLKGYPKTTGGDGMHIYIPLEPVYSYEESRTFAEMLAHLVQRDRPELFTAPRAVSKRQKGRVYFDWMQNGKIQDHRRAVCAARLSRRARGHAARMGARCGRDLRRDNSISTTLRSASRRRAICLPAC